MTQEKGLLQCPFQSENTDFSYILVLSRKFLYSSSQLLCLCIYHVLLLISIKWRGQANYLPEEDIAPGIAPHTQVNFIYFISSTWELYFLYVIINVVLFFILNLCADETEDEMDG